jgi:hypothetical protein
MKITKRGFSTRSTLNFYQFFKIIYFVQKRFLFVKIYKISFNVY